MTLTPIRQVLSTVSSSGVQTLLMGGQACVFYGAAQVSKDVDLLVLAETENFARLEEALVVLQARRIAVPPFDAATLGRGHAVHFRCGAPGVEGLRVDVMSELRGVPAFPELWERRTTVQAEDGAEFHLLSIPDLVLAKKTQRSKDWPVIELLVAIHHRENAATPTARQIMFWLREARTPELLCRLAAEFPRETTGVIVERPLLDLASRGEIDALREALDIELRAEQARDRAYWEPLRRELESFCRAERMG